MNIWYLNHYATPPDYGMPGRPYFLAQNMAKLGHSVVIICASNHHLRNKSAPEQDLNTCKKYSGVEYYHIPTRPYKGNGVGRFFNMVDYAKSAARLGSEVESGNITKPDILIPSCVHPLAFPPSRKIAGKLKAKLIYEVRDIWPLSLIELSGFSKWHPLIWWLGRIEKQAYRHADAVISLLPRALEHMQPLGLNPKRFYCIPNGVCLKEWSVRPDPLPEQHQDVFQRLKQKNKLIVVYTGAHGTPNALDQILDLAGINKNQDVPYHFVLIGDGVEKDRLMKRVENENISFVTFLPKIKKQQLIGVFEEADICFIGLKPSPVFRFGVSPNKLTDYLVAGKPIIYAVKAGNDRVQEAGAGVTVTPYDAEHLESVLQRFCEMPVAERDEMGKRGHHYAVKHLDWEKLANDYATVCSNI